MTVTLFQILGEKNLQKVPFSLKDVIRGRSHWHKTVNIFSCWKWSNLSFFKPSVCLWKPEKNPGCFTILIQVLIWKIFKDVVKCVTTWKLTWKQQKHICPRQFIWNFFLNFGLQLMCTALACQYSKTASQTLFWWKAAPFINVTFVTTQAAKDKPKGNAVCWSKFWF